MNLTITNEQKVHVTLNPVSANGNAAQIDGRPTFTVESGSATVEQDAEGNGAFIVSGSEAGDSVIKVTADADLGEGVRTIEDSITLTTTLPEATSLGLVADQPVTK